MPNLQNKMSISLKGCSIYYKPWGDKWVDINHGRCSGFPFNLELMYIKKFLIFVNRRRKSNQHQ